MDRYSMNEVDMHYQEGNRMDNHFRRPFWARSISGAEKRRRKKAAIRSVSENKDTLDSKINNRQKVFVPSSSNSTPNKDGEEGVKDSKTMKLTQPTNFEVYKTVIVSKEYPLVDITEDKLDLMRDALAMLIDGLPTGGFVPRLHTLLSQGVVIAICKDKETLDWLSSSIFTIPWIEACLKVMSVDDLLERVEMWLPGHKKISNSTIMERIQRQNLELPAKNWVVLDRTEEEKGLLFILAVDKESFKKILSQGSKLYCGAVRAAVYQPGHKRPDNKFT